MSDKPIGIVGGMGPFAGLDLFSKILEETVAVKDQEHLPVFLESVPNRIADRGRFVLGDSSDNPAAAITDVIRSLDRQGAFAVGIPCVTAHSSKIIDPVIRSIKRDEISAEFVHLIDVTISYIRDNYPDVRAVGVLSTSATYNDRIFFDALEESGFETVVHDHGVQDDLVSRAIFDTEFGIKAHAQPVTDKAKELIGQALHTVKKQGADAVILGCTELPLVLPDRSASSPSRRYAGVFCIDPTRALARELISRTAPGKLRPVVV